MNWYKRFKYSNKPSYIGIGHKSYFGQKTECREFVWWIDPRDERLISKVAEEDFGHRELMSPDDLVGGRRVLFKGRAELCPQGPKRVSVWNGTASVLPQDIVWKLQNAYGNDVQLHEYR